MRVILVAALARNRVIGRDGGLPWHLPADLKAFRRATLGKPVIMGRRTWESIPRALPGRTNIVVSRNRELAAEGATVCHGLSEALEFARSTGAGECMIIGGASLYAETLPLADEMLLTFVDAEVEGDTLFPAYEASAWQEASREHRRADDANPHALDFVRLLATGARADSPHKH